MITETVLPSERGIKRAAEIIKRGDVVAFPTETVYGLGANALDEAAVKKIFEAKGRPADNPLIVHISSLDMMKTVAADIPAEAYKLAERFWAGPLTMVLKKSSSVPSVTSGGLDTVGIRFPSHPAAKRLIELSGVPIAAPSANLSGSPSPTTFKRVYEDMNGRVPMIINGGSCEFGVESTVISLDNGCARILRPGAVTKEMLEQVIKNVTVDPGVLSELPEGAKVRSPGMKYKHYAPKARVIIVAGSLEAYREYVRKHAKERDFCLLFDKSERVPGIHYITYGSTAEEQAHRLFEALRNLDAKGADTVYARCPDTSGMGLAVYNRILRSAGFNIVEAENEE